MMPKKNLTKRRHLIREETIYKSVFPVLRICQTFGPLSVVLLAVFLAEFLSDFFVVAGITVGWVIIVMGALTGFCEMRTFSGYVLLLVGAKSFIGIVSATWFLFLVGIYGLFTVTDLEMVRWSVAFIGLGLPFLYFNILTIRAGYYFAFAPVEVKRTVAELSQQPLGAQAWLSGILGISFPIRHLKRSKALATALFLASGIAFACFAVGVLILVALSSVWFIEMPPTLFIVSVVIGLPVGIVARRLAQRLATASLQEAQKNDNRPPILFLRPFLDDQVGLRATSLPLLGRAINFIQRKANLDIILLEEGTAYGPVVALGQPTDRVPIYGAARGYFEDRDWKEGIAQLARDSLCIVICLSDSDSVLWEVQHILSSNYETKTLFLVPPQAGDPDSSRRLFAKLECTFGLVSKSSILAPVLTEREPVLAFYVASDGHTEVAVTSEFSEASYILALRWFFRSMPTRDQPMPRIVAFTIAVLLVSWFSLKGRVMGWIKPAPRRAAKGGPTRPANSGSGGHSVPEERSGQPQTGSRLGLSANAE